MNVAASGPATAVERTALAHVPAFVTLMSKEGLCCPTETVPKSFVVVLALRIAHEVAPPPSSVSPGITLAPEHAPLATNQIRPSVGRSARFICISFPVMA
jgi:hypothetical protein